MNWSKTSLSWVIDQKSGIMPETFDWEEIHSEEVQDIIGRAPIWVIRRGTMVVAGVIFLLLAGSWFIRYPETISAPVTLSAVPGPVKLVTRSAGRIIALWGRDGEQVKVGQVVAVVENAAATEDVLYLRQLIERLDTVADPGKTAAAIGIRKDLQVGGIQPAYAGLVRVMEQHGTSAASADAVRRLRGQIAVWENQYVLRSPVAGRLSLFRIRKENQYVEANEPIFMVTPAGREWMVNMEVPASQAGKIRRGQSVLIRLEGYPYREYGMLRAVVEGLTEVSLDGIYSVQMRLEDGFITTMRQKIDPGPDSKGVAEVTTRDRRILQKIIERL